MLKCCLEILVSEMTTSNCLQAITLNIMKTVEVVVATTEAEEVEHMAGKAEAEELAEETAQDMQDPWWVPKMNEMRG